MGLFSFLTKQPAPCSSNSVAPSLVNEYEELKRLYSLCEKRQSYSDTLSSCNSFLAFAQCVNVKSVTKSMVRDSKRESCYYYNSVFGCVFDSDPFLPTLISKIESLSKRTSLRLSKSNSFAQELNAVPLCNISVDCGGHLERKSLSDMPEAKYSPIGKSFNREKLTSFVVIDTETNGLKVQGGRILELSAIRYEDFEPVEAFSTLVNPGLPIPPDATAINGIADADVADAPSLACISSAFIEFVGNSTLVGYNLPFDLKFLFTRGIDLITPKRKMFDALELCRKAYKKDLSSFSLSDVCEHLGIYRDDAHRSLSDCFATVKVFSAAIDEITE